MAEKENVGGKEMTKKQLVQRLTDIYNGTLDPEEAHIQADQALLQYINDENVTKAFETIDKWYA